MGDQIDIELHRNYYEERGVHWLLFLYNKKKLKTRSNRTRDTNARSQSDRSVG